MERGVEGSERQHLNEMRYKLQQTEQKTKEELAKLETLQEERKGLERQIQGLQADVQARQLDIQKLLEIKPERGLMGSIKGVTALDNIELKATAIKGLQAKKQLHRVSEDYQRIKQLVPTIEERIQRDKELSRFKELEIAFQSLPTSVKNQLFSLTSKVLDKER